MPGLVPGIHVLLTRRRPKTWMAGTSPAMTTKASAFARQSFTTRTAPSAALVACAA